MGAQLAQQPAGGAQPAIAGQCPEGDQLLLTLQQRRRRWWLQPGEFLPEACTPGRQFKHHGLRIRQLQLRPAEGWSPLLFRWRPEPDAAARALPSCPPATLIGAGQAGGDGLQALHALARVVPQLPAEAAVDHQTHAVDGHRTFGDGAGEDHRSVVVGAAALKGPVLLLQWQLAMQRQDPPAPQGSSRVQQLLATDDLRQTRQEHQHTAARRQVDGVSFDCSENLARQGLIAAGKLMVGLHRVSPPFAFQNGGFRQTVAQV